VAPPHGAFFFDTEVDEVNTTTLALNTLHLLSSGLAEDFEQQVTATVQNCRQRPSLAAKDRSHN
jgi:hypothetical protein